MRQVHEGAAAGYANGARADAARLAEWILFLALSVSTSAWAEGGCKLTRLPEMLSGMQHGRPVTTAKINGQEARFLIDTGAFFGLISDATVSQYRLSTRLAPFGFYLLGVNGTITPKIATVKSFTLVGVDFHNVEFLAGGAEVQENIVGVVGQNFLHAMDLEFDLGNGSFRFVRLEGCKHSMLAYWTKPGDPYSELDLDSEQHESPTGWVLLNGKKIHALFDSGAGYSLLSLRAAGRAGVTPESPGVQEGGDTTGIGRDRVRTYLARFDSFEIGTEKVQNARLRFGDIRDAKIDMLVGVDFMMSHHILMATKEHQLYFTYNGGPVFDLRHTSSGDLPADKAGPEGGSAAPAAAGGEAAKTDPAEAAEAGRRGTALASRRDYAHAIPELTRACELDPANADYFYQRSLAYGESGRVKEAAADLDRALELRPAFVGARIARAESRLQAGDKAGALDDLQQADKSAPRELDARLGMAAAYRKAGKPEAAVRQYDTWLEVHPADPRAVYALEDRCRISAFGEDARKGLSDCSAAVRVVDKKGEGAAAVLGSRGFVRLRLGDNTGALGDFDAAVRAAPGDAWLLYGRGIALLRKTGGASGRTDIDAAVKMSPGVSQSFKRHGIGAEAN